MSGAAAAVTPAREAGTRQRQNWILTPLQDTVLVIGAPLLALLFAVSTFLVLGPSDATTCILLLHVVLTVAHHMPTFIRVYGDVELFQRFRWEFVFGPLVPFVFALGVLAYMGGRGFPVENFLYLFIMLAIWDPWHFLMQHYGFMRIYDRHNAAPRQLASRMDLALCAAWFLFIMLAAGEWLVGVLEDLFLSAHIPLVLCFSSGAVEQAQGFVRDIAMLVTLVYGAYLLWCRHRGYYISFAKLTLFATTFGVMYVAYTPNPWILSAAPGWSFPVGFAVLGIVHMTQYLAIVWRYNRSLASRRDGARPGVFRSLHARGGLLAGGAYVVVCLLYGGALTTVLDNRWLMSLLLATGFTSTLMHYYFDGFIWKMRRRQNRENLFPHASESGASTVVAAAGTAQGIERPRSAPAVLARHALYFVVPMAVLTVGAVWIWNGPGTNYVGYMMQAHVLYQEGRTAEALQQGRVALESMDRQAPAARRLAELQPTASREASLAFLVYNRSHYVEMLIPALEGAPADTQAVARHRERLAEAMGLLESALEREGDLAHPGRETMSRSDAHTVLASWRRELGGL